jgi:hypothetical protein
MRQRRTFEITIRCRRQRGDDASDGEGALDLASLKLVRSPRETTDAGNDQRERQNVNYKLHNVIYRLLANASDMHAVIN